MSMIDCPPAIPLMLFRNLCKSRTVSSSVVVSFFLSDRRWRLLSSDFEFSASFWCVTVTLARFGFRVGILAGALFRLAAFTLALAGFPSGVLLAREVLVVVFSSSGAETTSASSPTRFFDPDDRFFFFATFAASNNDDSFGCVLVGGGLFFRPPNEDLMAKVDDSASREDVVDSSSFLELAGRITISSSSSVLLFGFEEAGANRMEAVEVSPPTSSC